LWEKNGNSRNLSALLRRYQIVSYLRRYAPAMRPLAIIELGCGRGHLAHVLTSFGDVTAVDFAAATITANRVSYPQVTFVHCDLTEPGLVSTIGTFDVAVSTEVVEHIPIDSRSRYFRNLADVVKPDGLLVMTTPCWDHLSRLAKPGEDVAAFARRVAPQPENNFFAIRELVDCLEPDFEVIDQTTVQPCVRSRALDLLWKLCFLPVGYRFLNGLTRIFSIPGKYTAVVCRRRSDE
jgi:SAM-dependent methyltransferase